MKLRKLIYNLFFKKKKKSSRRRTTKKSGTSKVNATAQPEIVLRDGKYDTTLLRQQVSKTEYISNLRIGRSWILPQIIEMGFKSKLLRKSFDVDHFEKMIRSKYDLSQGGRRRTWDLLVRNYKAITESNGTSRRSRWWTKELAKDMVEWDYSMVGKRSKGINRKGCEEVLNSFDTLSNSSQIYAAICKYDKCRMRTRQIVTYRTNGYERPLPDSFVDAFMGDGAYNAMMTMIKVLGIRLKDDDGKFLSRDECIVEVETQAAVMSGRELIEYCKETFFDSGAFEYKKYVKER